MPHDDFAVEPIKGLQGYLRKGKTSCGKAPPIGGRSQRKACHFIGFLVTLFCLQFGDLPLFMISLERVAHWRPQCPLFSLGCWPV